MTLPVRSVGQSVSHNFQKGREVTLPCSYRSTCFQCWSTGLADRGPGCDLRPLPLCARHVHPPVQEDQVGQINIYKVFICKQVQR